MVRGDGDLQPVRVLAVVLLAALGGPGCEVVEEVPEAARMESVSAARSAGAVQLSPLPMTTVALGVIFPRVDMTVLPDLTHQDLTRGPDLTSSVDLANANADSGFAVEPLQSTSNFIRVKSPAQAMHYTFNKELRVFGDGDDANGWQWLCGSRTSADLRFYVDGVLKNTQAQDCVNIDTYETRSVRDSWSAALSLGSHTLTTKGLVCGSGGGGCANSGAGVVLNGMNSIQITIDPAPSHANTVSFASNQVLAGSAINWNDATVTCTNGATITGTASSVTIADSHIFGCGAYGTPGINLTVSGAVDVERSVFEATAPLALVVNGSGAVKFDANEFRSNMWVQYNASDPEQSPFLDLSGSTSGAKTFTGNRVGGGILKITGMSGWQIGGLHDSQGNIFMGPRAVVRLENANNATIQGNVLWHDYQGGWSQGFNLENISSGSTGMVVEHNVIRGSSWPVQGLCGTFRYNVVLDSGHDFVRSACPGSVFHHNIFSHTGAGGTDVVGSFDGGALLFNGETAVVFYNNTFDGGTSVTGYGFSSPAIAINAGASVASARSNIFYDFANSSSFGDGIVSGARGPSTGTLTSADYNLFYNPSAGSMTHYGPLGGGAHAHDVSANPGFLAGGEAPNAIDWGGVWGGTTPTSFILARYRDRFRPAPGSPPCDAGDPSDGTGTDIGAVGCGVEAAADLFGMVMDSARVMVSPTLLASMRARFNGATAQWTAFKATIDTELPIAYPEGGSYEGSDCAQIPQMLMGWLSIKNSTAWTANTGGARALARSYSQKALGVMKTCLFGFVNLDNHGRQFLARGTGAQTVFTLPGTFTTGPTVYTGTRSVIGPITKGAANTGDIATGTNGDWYFQKVSLTSDGTPAYSEITSWKHGLQWTCTDALPTYCSAYVSWEPAGAEPSPGSQYYLTVVDLSTALTQLATPANYTVSGTTLTFSVAPSANTLIFIKGIFGTDSADGSTVAFQNTLNHQAGGNALMTDVDHGYGSRNDVYACAGLDWIGPVPWFSAADRAEMQAVCSGWYDFLTTSCADVSSGNCWDARNPTSNYGAGHELTLAVVAAALEHQRFRDGPRIRDAMATFVNAYTLPNAITGGNPSDRGGYPLEAWGGYGNDAAENIAMAGQALYQSRMLPSLNSIAPYQTWSNAAIENLVSVAPTKATTVQQAEAQGWPSLFPSRVMRTMLPSADATHQAYARWVVNSSNGWAVDSSHPTGNWMHWLWVDPAGTSTDPVGVLPLANYADGAELVTMRSDWTFNGTFASLFCGDASDVSAAHQSFNAGHMNVSRGADQLLINVRNFVDDFSQSGAQSTWANLLQIDDANAGGSCGQVYAFSQGGWTNNEIGITAFELGSGYTLAAGDYKAGYYNNSTPCGPATTLTRTLLHVRPDHLFVHDRVVLRAGGSAWVARQNWHSANKSFNVSGTTFKVDNGSGRVFGSAFGSHALALTDSAIVVNGTTARELQITASPRSSLTEEYWTGLHVTTTATGSSDTMANVVDSNGGMRCWQIGADMACDTQATTALSTSATVAITAPATVTNLVLVNLQSSRSYTITGATSSPVTSSAKGVLVVGLSGAGGAVTVH